MNFKKIPSYSIITISAILFFLFIINIYNPLLFKSNNFISSENNRDSNNVLNELYMKNQYKRQETEKAKIYYKQSNFAS